MIWWNKKDGTPNSDQEVQAALLLSAQTRDYRSRLWDDSHSPTDATGSWSDEAWRNNAQLMRAADEAIVEGWELHGGDPDKIREDFKKSFWWWERRYD